MNSRTRIKTLTRETIAQNGPLFDSEEQMPRHVLTTGVGTILDARECLILITGQEKAGIAARAIEGPITSMVSASMTQVHTCCTAILDDEAAAELQHADYYRWVAENKPEWERIEWE